MRRCGGRSWPPPRHPRGGHRRRRGGRSVRAGAHCRTPVTVAVGCAGGRHRAATVAMAIADRLRKTRPARWGSCTATLTCPWSTADLPPHLTVPKIARPSTELPSRRDDMSNLPDWMHDHLPPARPVRRPGLVRRVLDAVGGYRTYLCPQADCDVRVRVRGMDAGEERRYQELATDHARHNRARRDLQNYLGGGRSHRQADRPPRGFRAHPLHVPVRDVIGGPAMGPRSRTTIQIPRQRGRRRASAAHLIDFGRGTAPVVLVVPHRPSLLGRTALAAGGALWRHRRACAPTWTALGLYLATAVIRDSVPFAWAPLTAGAVMLPVAGELARRKLPLAAQRRRANALRPAIAAGGGVLGWMAALCAFGPFNTPIALLWLGGTAAAQVLWWRTRQQRRDTAAPAPAGKTLQP